MKQTVENKISELLNSGFKLNINQVFGKAGDIFKGIAGYAIVALILYLIATSLIGWLIELVLPVTALDQDELIELIEAGDYETAAEIYKESLANGGGISLVLNSLIGSAVLPIMYSIYNMAYKFDHYQNVEFSDLFIHYKNGKFLTLFLTNLVIQIVYSLGLFLCIIPGFIVYTMWILAIPLVIFADADLKTALNSSMKLAFKDFGGFALVVLSIIGIYIVGFLLCCVGLIAAVPFTYVFIYVVYKEIIGFPDQRTEIDEIGTDIYKDNPYMN